MEVAFLVIAVIGLLALSQGGGGGQVQGSIQYAPNSPPQPWQPTPAGNFGPPMVPSQGANVGAPLISGAAQIGTKIGTSGVAAGGLAAGAITAGIGIAAAIGISLWQAHEARLHGAKNENQAVDQYVPVFDSFVKQIVAAYNSGRCTKADAAQACQQMDRSLYNTFRSFVGQPGTAWSDVNGMAGKCDKTCTVGCCVYFGDLGPVLNNISYVLGFPTGKWGQGDPRISGRTITVPKVYPSKYSSYTRPLYTVTLK